MRWIATTLLLIGSIGAGPATRPSTRSVETRPAMTEEESAYRFAMVVATNRLDTDTEYAAAQKAKAAAEGKLKTVKDDDARFAAATEVLKAKDAMRDRMFVLVDADDDVLQTGLAWAEAVRRAEPKKPKPTGNVYGARHNSRQGDRRSAVQQAKRNNRLVIGMTLAEAKDATGAVGAHLVAESAGSQVYQWEATVRGYDPLLRRTVNWGHGMILATFEGGELVSYVRE